MVFEVIEVWQEFVQLFGVAVVIGFVDQIRTRGDDKRGHIEEGLLINHVVSSGGLSEIGGSLLLSRDGDLGVEASGSLGGGSEAE